MKNYYVKYVIFLLAYMVLQAQEPWSFVYHYVPKKNELLAHKEKKHMTYKKKNTMPFTQLILTWNAQRPKTGSFNFKIRVRDAESQKWDTLLSAAVWGKEQKSFFSRGSFSTFPYSRLELEKGHTADAFEIDIEGDGDASMNLINALFVSLSNEHEFISEPMHMRGKGLRSKKVKRVAKKSQMMINHPRANALCSPTSVSMLAQTFSKRYMDPLLVAQYVYDPALNIFGNWTFNMAHAFELTKGVPYFYVTRPSSFAELYDQLAKNIPIAVSIRGPIEGGHTPYKNGHLLVVIGWDAADRKVICFDPAAQELDDVETEYDIDEFITAWERSRRLTYFPSFKIS